MKSTYKMNYSLQFLSAAAALVLAQPALAAVTFTQSTMDISSAGTGAEILNNGILVEANHFGSPGTTLAAAGPVTLDNGLKFGNSTTNITIGGPQNATDNDGKNFTPAVTNPAFDAFAGTYIWIAYSNSVSTISIPGLTIGQEYRLQMISFGSANAGVTVEGDATIWQNANSLFTADWIAVDSQADITLSRKNDGEVNFNGYALHAIPEPSAALLGGLGALALLRRRRNQ